VVAAAAAGFLIGGSGSDSEDGGGEAPALNSSASAGGLELSFPDTWARASGGSELPGLPLDDIALAPKGQPGSALNAGMTNGSGVTLLPKPFLATLPSEPKGEPVKLGDLQAFRYTGLKPEGFDGALTVYTVPTTGGVATSACQASAADADEFLPECERVAASLQLAGVEAVALGPSDEYASALNKTLGTLSSARSSGEKKLQQAGTQKAQAQAARALADSYGKAASSMGDAPAGPAERTANEAIVASMAAVQRAYEKLGSAAANDNSGAYQAASRAVQSGQARLDEALKSLELLGYQVS
jgi:hypothetical protein